MTSTENSPVFEDRFSENIFSKESRSTIQDDLKEKVQILNHL